jgi:hypothetical protein
MDRQPMQTAFSSLQRLGARLWGSVTKPLTCQPQPNTHTLRQSHRSLLTRFPGGVPSACERRADRSGIAGVAQTWPAIPPLPERSGFSWRTV